MSNARKMTCKLLDMVDEHMIDKDLVIQACLSYMSESEVADMMRINDFIMEEEEENA